LFAFQAFNKNLGASQFHDINHARFSI